MKKKLLSALFCAVLTLMLLPVTAKADIGPKPSVNITFTDMGDELCYGTLLSKNPSTGPASVWDGVDEHAQHNENESYSYSELDYAAWKAFVEYQDPDGYYFLQWAWRVDESKSLSWGYYPPDSFRILLYFPESGAFAASGIYERYAFDSYYTVSMKGVSIGAVEYDKEASTNDRINAYRSYNYTVEILSLLARIVLTILLELVIALLFGYRGKKALLLVTGVNVLTQVLLNVLLNIIDYYSGSLAFTVCYFLLEFAVLVIEAAVYARYLGRSSGKKPWLAVLYAFAANAASFAAGLYIAHWLPGIF